MPTLLAALQQIENAVANVKSELARETDPLKVKGLTMLFNQSAQFKNSLIEQLQIYKEQLIEDKAA